MLFNNGYNATPKQIWKKGALIKRTEIWVKINTKNRDKYWTEIKSVKVDL